MRPKDHSLAYPRVLQQQTQPPTHPTLHIAPQIPFPESPMPNMVSPSNRLTTSYRDVYSSSHNLRRQPMPHENTQAPIADEYSAGTNRTAGPMALGTSSDMNTDSRTVTLEWQRTGGAWTQTQVLATDPIRDPMSSIWPTHLRLEIVDRRICTMDIQKWAHKNRAPLLRIKGVPETDNRDFDELVKWLRDWSGCAIAGWEVGGRYKARLLLAPLCMDLLCAAFPVTGIPGLPTPQSREPVRVKRRVVRRFPSMPIPMVVPMSPYMEAAHVMLTPQQAQPQQWTRPQADYPPLDTMQPPLGDHSMLGPWSQAAAFTPVRAASPPHLRLEQQALAEGPLQQSHAQRSVEIASQDMVVVDSELDNEQADAGTPFMAPDSPRSVPPAGENSSPWFGVGEDDTSYAGVDSVFSDADPIGSRVGLSSGDGRDGIMNEIGNLGMEAMPIPSADLGAFGDFDMSRYMDWSGQGDK